MLRLNNPKLSSYSIVFCLLLLVSSITNSKSKDNFYSEIKTYCFSKETFEQFYEVYNAKDAFYWTDFLFKKDPSKNKFFFENGSKYLLQNSSFKSANLSYSTNQSFEFYETYFEESRYTKGINTKLTYINNSDSRDYVPYIGRCQYEEISFGYNQLHVPSEPLNPLKNDIISIIDEEKHVAQLFNIMYQAGRGLLYIFQNGFFSQDISVDLIKYSEHRGFQNFKFDNALLLR